MIITLDEEGLFSVLDSLGIKVTGETTQDYIAYCPFHLNNDTPALNVGKEAPHPFRCWNDSCGVSGSLPRLVEVVGEMSPMQALRFINQFKTGAKTNLDKILQREPDSLYEPVSKDILNRVRVDWEDEESWGKLQPLLDRGFSQRILQVFDVGYSRVRHRITIPVFDENGDLVGLSGRATLPGQKPKYWDKGVPKKYVLFNLNRAKAYEEVIIVEGPLDAIRVAQAGYFNVVSVLGGFYSIEQAQKLNRLVKTVIIFTDNDEAGQALAERIEVVSREKGKNVYYAKYPEGMKDPGEMTEEQIADAIKSKRSVLAKKLEGFGGKN